MGRLWCSADLKTRSAVSGSLRERIHHFNLVRGTGVESEKLPRESWSRW
jgi:hypothetical protein